MATLIQLIDDVVANKFVIRDEVLNIGRHPSSDVQIEDTAVSSQHAKIEGKPNEHFPQFKEYFISDLGSTNGTFVNDQKITKTQRLRNGDNVRFAWNTFKFVDDSEAQLEKTTHML